jgi:hypothetical protein
MDRMIRNAKFQANHLGHPPASPELPSETIRFGPTLQECGETSELVGGQAPGGAGRRSMTEGLWAVLPRPLQPLADGGGADPQGLGNVLLRPTLLLEVPGLEPSSFSPVQRYGRHTWQRTRSRHLD